MESTTTTTDHAAMRLIADAMRDAATTASEQAAEARRSASEARSKGAGGYLAHGLARSYVPAYGVSTPVFIAQSLPQENPVMNGLRDGGRAAVDDLGTD